MSFEKVHQPKKQEAEVSSEPGSPGGFCGVVIQRCVHWQPGGKMLRQLIFRYCSIFKAKWSAFSGLLFTCQLLVISDSFVSVTVVLVLKWLLVLKGWCARNEELVTLRPFSCQWGLCAPLSDLGRHRGETNCLLAVPVPQCDWWGPDNQLRCWYVHSRDLHLGEGHL